EGRGARRHLLRRCALPTPGRAPRAREPRLRGLARRAWTPRALLWTRGSPRELSYDDREPYARSKARNATDELAAGGRCARCTSIRRRALRSPKVHMHRQRRAGRLSNHGNGYAAGRVGGLRRRGPPPGRLAPRRLLDTGRSGGVVAVAGAAFGFLRARPRGTPRREARHAHFAKSRT